MRRVKVATQGIKVIMEGARKAKVMKGKRLLEEVEFEDGDDLVASIETLKEAYSGPIVISKPKGRFVSFEKELASSKKRSPGNPNGFQSTDAVPMSAIDEAISDLSDIGSDSISYAVWNRAIKVLSFRGSGGSNPANIRGVVSYPAALGAIDRIFPGLTGISVSRIDSDSLLIRIKA